MAKIANCRTASILACPWIPDRVEETVGEVTSSTDFTVDTSDSVYDWLGNKYYKITTASGVTGYLIEGAIG